jgi:hypothetical protein
MKGMQGVVVFFHLMFINNNMPMEVATDAVFVKFELSLHLD